MMLSEDYKVLEATGAGDAMLQISCKSMVDAILLGNLRQDGREVGFLDKIRNSGYGSIPVLVILEDSEEDPGLEALDHGAWDYVTRPVRPKTLRNRLDRAVHHCKISSYNPLVYMSERDRLTGLYNREKMFAETRRMIDRHMDTLFVFLRFDIDRFRLYNAVFGEHRGISPYPDGGNHRGHSRLL